MGIYEQIKKVCKDNNISINKLEKELGFARSSINKFNTNKPSVDKLQEVADYFNVSIDFLLGRTDDPTDYDDGDLISETSGSALDHFNGDVKRALEFQKVVDREALNDEDYLRYLDESGQRKRELDDFINEPSSEVSFLDNLMVDGNPLTEEEKQQVIDAMTIALEMVKKRKK